MKPLLPKTFVLNNKYLQPILSPSPDIYFNKKLSDDEFYNISKGYYQKLIDEKIIYKSENDYYLYRIDSESHSQTGLISLLNIQDYINNNIKPHEKILVSKGKERAEQLSKVKFQLCPIYLFYDRSYNHEIFFPHMDQTHFLHPYMYYFYYISINHLQIHL